MDGIEDASVDLYSTGGQVMMKWLEMALFVMSNLVFNT